MKINIITILFVIAIILKFGNHSFLFAFCAGLVFLSYLLTAKEVELRRILGVINSNKLILFSFVISLFSTILNSLYNQSIIYNYIFEIVLYGLLSVIGVFVYVVNGENYIVKGFKQIVTISFFLGILAIFEFFTNNNWFFKFVNVPDHLTWNTGIHYRVSSAFLHPIPCSNAFMISLFACFFILKKNYYRSVFLTILVLSILLTQSRSTWLAIFFVMFLYGLMYLKSSTDTFRSVLKFTIIIVVILALFQYFDFLREIILNRFEATKTVDSDYQRIATYSYIFDKIVSSNIYQVLFGHGAHSCSFVMLKKTLQWDDFSTTDNLYVSDLYNFGLFYIMVVIFQFFKVIKMLKNNNNLIRMFVCIFIGSEVCFFFYEPFVSYPIAFLFFFSFGTLLAINRDIKANSIIKIVSKCTQ